MMAEKTGDNPWVVMVPHDNALNHAILSRNIIKQSETNAKIIALVSPSVSMETRKKLIQIYDTVVVEETVKEVDLPCSSFRLKTQTLDFENFELDQKGMKKIFENEKIVNEDPRSGIMADDQSNWVAIVGMSCRFPQANSIEEYWDLLVNGKNTCSTTPESRTKLVNVDPGMKANFLKCPVDQFDASFFGFSPSEASFADPQARLLLEVSWEALEDAGINPDKIRGTKVGVFYGSWLQDYRDALNDSSSRQSQDFIRKYLGNGFGPTAAKISFFYGLTGPNIATESGCSSSIVAIDMACKSLQQKECTMALACGANLMLHLNKQNIVWAEDGMSKVFDAGANGYSRAEGVAVLVLKRYSDAVLDNDNIHGIIRGVGTSQEGLSKSFGAPTIQSEYESMRDALVAAKVTPTEVDYVEAHGTGTPVGDPTEAAAIVKAYQSGSTRREFPLIIGSGKTNVGHTESCSGMAGIIKVLLSMKHELIPKHLNLTRLNPQIDFTTIPGIIPLEPSPWPRKLNEQPRIAGVSSFGITGTDVHLIIQEPPIKKEYQNENTPSNPQILTLSAKSNIALEQMTNEFLTYLESPVNHHPIHDITYTANVCRAHHPVRRAIVGSSIAEMVTNIRKGCNMYSSPKDTSKKVCFTFPGLVGTMPLEHMLQLYLTIPHFKDALDVCDQMFQQVFPNSPSLVEMLFKNDMESPNTPKGVEWYALIVTCHFSLTKLWNKWGIFPNLVMGHCFGEFSAAVVCGALNLKDVFEMLKMIPHFLHTQSVEPASMLAVNSSHLSVENLIHEFFLNRQTSSSQSDWIDIAVVNSDLQTVVVGPPATITAFQQHCAQQDIKFKIVSSDFCPHSRAIEAACQKSFEAFNKVIHHPIKIPYISSVTGELVKDSDLNGMFWYKVLRNCVNFKQACLSAMNTKLADIFLEIGRDESLTKFTKTNLEVNQNFLSSLASFPKKYYGIYNTLAEMYGLGIQVNWDNFHNSVKRNKVSLPHYPFQRKSFWYERKTCSSERNIVLDRLEVRQNQLDCWNVSVHPFLGRDMEVPPAFGNFAHFRNDNFLCENQQTNFVYDHLIGDNVIFPGAGFLEMMLSSWKLAMKLENISEYSIEKFIIHEPLLLDKCSPFSIVNVVNKDTGNVCIYTTTETGLKWRLHATADVTLDEPASNQLVEIFGKNNIMNTVDLIDESEKRANEFYLNASKVGLNFGPAFKSLKHIQLTEAGDMVAEIEDIRETADSFSCHPILIDAMIQGFMVHTKPAMTKLHVPVKINKFVLLSPSSLSGNGKLFVHCQKGNTTIVSLVDQNGQVVALMRCPELVPTTVENVLAAAVMKSEGQSDNNHVPNSISVYDVIWKRAKLYQPSPIIQPGDLSETVDAECQNELSELQRKQNILNVFSEQEAKLDGTMNRLCYLYVVKALFEIGWVQEIGLNIFKEDTVNIEEKWGILPGLIKGFRHFVSYLNENEELLPTTIELVECGIKSILELPIVKGYNAMKTIHKCGWNLAGILRGNISPHKILFGEDNLAEHFYRTSRFVKSHESLEKLFTLYASKKAASFNGQQHTLKILEVGAGTGFFPKRILPVLKKLGIKFHYHFTDISRTLVSRAKETFEEDSKDFTFKVLNLEIDPLKQGFPAGYFDIVFALDVLHATRNLHDTLRNIQMVTKLGGVLLLGETEKPVRDVDIIFGCLEGYWLFEDNIRKNHCTLNSNMWLRIMAENGFSGNPCQMLSCEGQMSVISACKTDDKLSPHLTKAEWVVFEFGLGAFSEYKYIMESVTNRNFTVFTLDPKLRDEQLQEYINNCLRGDFEGVLIWMCPPTSIICDPIARQVVEPLLYISKYLQQAKLKTLPKLHLVTADCWDLPYPINVHEMNSQGPTLAQAWGFMRSARIELTGISSKSIDLEMSSDIHAKVTQLATELWLDDRETEVVYRKGTRYVRRLQEQMAKSGSTHIPNEETFNVELPKSKALCDIKFTEMCSIETLEQHQVRIEVRSVALNFKDVFAVLKPSSEFENLTSIGLDFSGVVTEVGRNGGRWKVGDAVFGLKCDQGCMRSHLITNENLLVAMPSSFTFAEASTLPTVFATAWHCMVNVAKLEKGQTMLLHAASGGVGLAAIQIAKILGVNVIGTAGSEKKRSFLRRLGVEYVFNSRTLDFKTGVAKVTGGRGADMVLNCLTGPGFKESSLAVCRDGGHFVEISKMDIWSEAEVRDMRSKVNYTVVDLTQVDNLVLHQIMEKLSDLLGEGNIQPLHHVTYPANCLNQALSYLQKAKQIGKVVINMPIKLAGERKSCIFNERSTYLITGGKAAIGFAVCKWMVKEQGVKYVVLVSRSQANENVTQAIVELERDFGAVIICKEVDVSDYTQCKTLIEQDLKDLPPLRGVHHCAAITSDHILSNQTWSKFEQVISPKAGGAWNLHRLTMETPLEHFVLYSSAVSVFGNPGQINYACANSYLDNLSALRLSMGLPALLVNWGQWKAGLGENLEMTSFKPFCVEEGIQALNCFMQSCHEQQNQIVPGTIIFSGLLNLAPYFRNTLLEDIVISSSVTGQNESSQDVASSTIKVDGFCLITQLKMCANGHTKETVVKTFVLQMLCETLGMSKEDIRDDVNFTDMGMDSIMSIEFTNKMNSALALGGDDDVQEDFSIQLDLEENGTLQKLTSFILKAWEQVKSSDEPSIISKR